MTAGPDARLPPRWFGALTGLVFAVSLLKGLRMPGLWAVTQLTFNYSHGFIRRGLVGQLLRMVGGRRVYRYNVLVLVSAILFVVLAVLSYAVVRRMLRAGRGEVGPKAAVLAFAASPGVTFMAHEIGYLDYVGLSMVLAVILIAARARRRYLVFYCAGATATAMALVHEALVVMFLPALLFMMICAGIREARAGRPAPANRLLMCVHAGAATASAVVAAVLVSTAGTTTPAAAGALQASIAALANFPLRDDAFRAISQPVSLVDWRAQDAATRLYLLKSFVAVLPGLSFLVYYGVRVIRALAVHRAARMMLVTVFLAATISPLSLTLIGLDLPRWTAISVVSCFCSIAALRLFFPPDMHGGGADDARTAVLAGAAVILGLCGTNYLFDRQTVHWFPFTEPLKSAVQIVNGRFTFVPPL